MDVLDIPFTSKMQQPDASGWLCHALFGDGDTPGDRVPLLVPAGQ